VLSGLTYVVDPELLFAEEADLFIRIASRFPVIFNLGVLARYRMHPSSDTWTNSENFIRDARRMMQTFEELGLDPTVVRDGLLEAAYWISAMSNWMKRDGERARQHLCAMRGRRIRRLVFWCLTFAPTVWYRCCCVWRGSAHFDLAPGGTDMRWCSCVASYDDRPTARFSRKFCAFAALHIARKCGKSRRLGNQANCPTGADGVRLSVDAHHRFALLRIGRLHRAILLHSFDTRVVL